MPRSHPWHRKHAGKSHEKPQRDATADDAADYCRNTEGQAHLTLEVLCRARQVSLGEVYPLPEVMNDGQTGHQILPQRFGYRHDLDLRITCELTCSLSDFTEFHLAGWQEKPDELLSDRTHRR